MTQQALLTTSVSLHEFTETLLWSGWDTYSWWYDWAISPSEGERDSSDLLVIRHEDKNEPDSLVTSSYTVVDLLEAYNLTVRSWASSGLCLTLDDIDCSIGDVVFQRLVYGEVVFG